MIIGDPYKLAFIIERIPEWDNNYINGIMFVSVNGQIYPKDVRTTTFNSELHSILSADSAFISPVCNQELYLQNSSRLLRYFNDSQI